MKKIGEGWDYNVYVQPNSRVIKIRKTKPQLLWLLLRTVNIVPFFKVIFTNYIWSSVTPSCTFVRNLISQKPEMAWFFGNPIFGDNDSYSQDTVTPLRNYFANHTLGENQKIIDGYVDTVKLMWRDGFSDTSFKFSKNYAVDNEGRVILIDFSNLTQDRDIVEKLLTNDFLLKIWVYRKMTDWKLKAYYRKAVAEKLTASALLSLWK